MNLKTRIHNLFCTLNYWWIWLTTLGATDTIYFKNSDGRLVDAEDWEGYNNCLYPGCGHYLCEHSDGSPMTVSYVSPEHSATTGTRVGDQVTWPRGCNNAGCPCDGFWTNEDLLGWVQELNFARIHGTFELQQVPGVLGVDSIVQTRINMETYLNTQQHEAAIEAVYEAEERLLEKHPRVAFDFHTRWDDKY